VQSYGRWKNICEEAIKTDFRETGYEDDRRIKVAQGSVQCWGGWGCGISSGESSYYSVI
jgi:hypothetical protein